MDTPIRLSYLVVGALVLGVAVAVGKASFSDSDGVSAINTSVASTVPGSDTAPATAPSASEAIGAFTVRGLDGTVSPLVVPGQPSIVMVSSRTCGWCKRALADIGELSAGRPVPRLTLLTLEGAAEGTPMVAKENITGARLVGPSGGSDQVMLTFRYPGTPTFVAIDRNGRVVKTMPGYPIRQEMEHWFAVMVGDQDAP